MKKTFYGLALMFLFVGSINAQKKKKPIELLDKNLSHFEKWIGVPHTSVKDLPDGTFQADIVTQGTPLGLNNDLKNIFTTTSENGEVILNISGEIYGCISTKENYSNYHLSTLFRWGDKKWAPRLNAKRDTGILYHSYGDHGRFWKTWKTALEYQVQEQDLGDFIPLGGNTATPKVGEPVVEIRGDFSKVKKFDPNSETYSSGNGYIQAASEHDAPHGEWNLLEIYVVGNDAVHVVNGEIVMVVENAMNPENGKPLTEGQIQIQSEAAECYYKQMVLTPIKKFPRFIRKQVRFK
ncbi:DUF1080 domain-containing protein [Algibacter sp. 2305UL17-15]|uniref:3-keto-disaccharide hydrolase n=1 Tax=Algibacter sp. 2305UL17-15 TaxID=3231268 RepID=UPI00345A309E